MPSTAIITGAAQGIGLAIALRLAEDGCNVVLNDVESKLLTLQGIADELNARVSTGSGAVAIAIAGNVSLEEDVMNIVNVAVATFGSLDIMVANAGVYIRGSVIETTTEDWDRGFAINTRGTFLCIKEAGKQMIKQGKGGRIIAASSVGGKTGFKNSSLYCGTKFAVRGIVQCAAIEFGEHKITVNAYSPGLTQTAMLEVCDKGHAEEDDLEPGQWTAGIRKSIPLSEIGKPEYVADLVSFLASEKGCYITGQAASDVYFVLPVFVANSRV